MPDRRQSISDDASIAVGESVAPMARRGRADVKEDQDPDAREHASSVDGQHDNAGVLGGIARGPAHANEAGSNDSHAGRDLRGDEDRELVQEQEEGDADERRVVKNDKATQDFLNEHLPGLSLTTQIDSICSYTDLLWKLLHEKCKFPERQRLGQTAEYLNFGLVRVPGKALPVWSRDSLNGHGLLCKIMVAFFHKHVVCKSTDKELFCLVDKADVAREYGTDDLPFTSCTVNKGFKSGLHIDENDSGYSFAVHIGPDPACGGGLFIHVPCKFKRQKLIDHPSNRVTAATHVVAEDKRIKPGRTVSQGEQLPGIFVDTKTPVCFHAQDEHATANADPGRIAIIFYSQRKVRPERKLELQCLGFVPPPTRCLGLGYYAGCNFFAQPRGGAPAGALLGVQLPKSAASASSASRLPKMEQQSVKQEPEVVGDHQAPAPPAAALLAVAKNEPQHEHVVNAASKKVKVEQAPEQLEREAPEADVVMADLEDEIDAAPEEMSPPALPQHDEPKKTQRGRHVSKISADVQGYLDRGHDVPDALMEELDEAIMAEAAKKAGSASSLQEQAAPAVPPRHGKEPENDERENARTTGAAHATAKANNPPPGTVGASSSSAAPMSFSADYADLFFGQPPTDGDEEEEPQYFLPDTVTLPLNSGAFDSYSAGPAAGVPQQAAHGGGTGSRVVSGREGTGTGALLLEKDSRGMSAQAKAEGGSLLPKDESGVHERKSKKRGSVKAEGAPEAGTKKQKSNKQAKSKKGPQDSTASRVKLGDEEGLSVAKGYNWKADHEDLEGQADGSGYLEDYANESAEAPLLLQRDIPMTIPEARPSTILHIIHADAHLEPAESSPRTLRKQNSDSVDGWEQLVQEVLGVVREKRGHDHSCSKSESFPGAEGAAHDLQFLLPVCQPWGPTKPFPRLGDGLSKSQEKLLCQLFDWWKVVRDLLAIWSDAQLKNYSQSARSNGLDSGSNHCPPLSTETQRKFVSQHKWFPWSHIRRQLYVLETFWMLKHTSQVCKLPWAIPVVFTEKQQLPTYFEEQMRTVPGAPLQQGEQTHGVGVKSKAKKDTGGNSEGTGGSLWDHLRNPFGRKK
ncbi:unnamed protein product [Amoebophrya sp. A120]|nr:unnamed protein product [Amoebophrya sp. A120]|eukprot:GSA120T00012162001.1